MITFRSLFKMFNDNNGKIKNKINIKVNKICIKKYSKMFKTINILIKYIFNYIK